MSDIDKIFIFDSYLDDIKVGSNDSAEGARNYAKSSFFDDDERKNIKVKVYISMSFLKEHLTGKMKDCHSEEEVCNVVTDFMKTLKSKIDAEVGIDDIRGSFFK